MTKSDSIKNIAVALVKFQAEVKNPANSATNPHFKNRYAPLNDILNDVRPLLTKHGLSVLQMPGGDGERVTCKTLLMHESGEWIESDELVLKADKVTAQGAGSAITYGRRYQISALLGIASEDDDDGNHASDPKPRAKKETEPNGKPDPTIEKARLLTLIGQASQTLNADQKKDIMNANFPGKKAEQLTADQLSVLYEKIKEVALS